VGRKDEGIAALRECGEIASALRLLNPLYFPWRSDLAMDLPVASFSDRSHTASQPQLSPDPRA